MNYSEKDILNFLTACFEDLSSLEMNYVMFGNNLAWCYLTYQREGGEIRGDILKEFYAQNPTNFYIKDLGTVLPAMFYTLANIGQDPVKFHNKLDIEIWGAMEAAEYMQKFMHKDLSPL